jgi:hypothetical protein
MTKITKIMLAVITSVALSTASFAGELSVTGGAKATYSIMSSDGLSSQNEQGKGLGLTNEFTLGASGELDNGYAWNYAIDMDNGGTQDDGQLTVKLNDLGTVGVFISEGNLSTKYMFDASAYGVGSDTGYAGSATTADIMQYGSGIHLYNNVQYHTPADLLPYSTSFKVAYSPGGDGDASAVSSGNARGTGSEASQSVTQYQLTTAPITGLNIGLSYLTKDSNASYQEYETGSAAVKYTYGAFTAGYAQTRIAPDIEAMATGLAIINRYDNMAFSLGYKVNDDLSVSYTEEDSERSISTQGAITHNIGSGDNVIMNISTIQAAYTMGGMTLSLSQKDVENDSYTNKKDMKEMLFAVAMAF